MIGLIMWLSPFAGVVLADFYVLRKSVVDVAELYKSPETSAYGDVNWPGIISFFVGLVAGWFFQNGLLPVFKGPIAVHLLGGADLSWLVGTLVAGGLYLMLSPKRAIAGATVIS